MNVFLTHSTWKNYMYSTYASLFLSYTCSIHVNTHVFLSHRGLTGYVAVDDGGFERSASIRIDWEKAWGTSCEPVGLAGGFKDGWPEKQQQKPWVSSCWVSSKKEKSLFVIVENAFGCFAFLKSINFWKISKFKPILHQCKKKLK